MVPKTCYYWVETDSQLFCLYIKKDRLHDEIGLIDIMNSERLSAVSFSMQSFQTRSRGKILLLCALRVEMYR